jgi:hypothetical protein
MTQKHNFSPHPYFIHCSSASISWSWGKLISQCAWSSFWYYYNELPVVLAQSQHWQRSMAAHLWPMVAAAMAVIVINCSKGTKEKNNNQLRKMPHDDSAKIDGGGCHKYAQGHDWQATGWGGGRIIITVPFLWQSSD